MYPESWSGRRFEKGKLFLFFIEEGVKINQDYYIEHVLENHLFERAKILYGEDFFCAMQQSKRDQM
jgi:hypothetical protein